MTTSRMTTTSFVQSSLGILLGGAGAVGSLVVGLALGPATWPLCAAVAALSLWALMVVLRPPYRFWHWASLTVGSCLGMVAGLSMALGISSQSHLQTALEATSFESAVMGALEHSQCELASDLLSGDLSLLSQRPALAVPVRWEMWSQAAAHGCIPGETLSRARQRLREHLEVARLPAGVEREGLLRQVGLDTRQP